MKFEEKRMYMMTPDIYNDLKEKLGKEPQYAYFDCAKMIYRTYLTKDEVLILNTRNVIN